MAPIPAHVPRKSQTADAAINRQTSIIERERERKKTKTHRSPGHHSCQSGWVCISLSINPQRYNTTPCEMCFNCLQLDQFVLHIKAMKHDRSSCKMYSCKQRYGSIVCIRISVVFPLDCFGWVLLGLLWLWKYPPLCLGLSSTYRRRWWLLLKCFAYVCVGCPSGCCVCHRCPFSVSLRGSWDYWHQIGTDKTLRVGVSF